VASLMSGTKDPRIVLELDFWVLVPRVAETPQRLSSVALAR
jgi:hypothetical protein